MKATRDWGRLVGIMVPNCAVSVFVPNGSVPVKVAATRLSAVLVLTEVVPVTV